MVPPSRVEAPSNRSTQGGTSHVEASRVVHEAATSECQASLFSATMMAHLDFSPTAVFKMAAMICTMGNSTVAKALKAEIQAEEAVESPEDTIQRLFLAATRVKTMLARPAIKRSSITPRVVVVDNS
jgi:ABC-type iron transport system FetAB permease component